MQDSAGSESRGMTLEAEVLPGGVLLTRSTNFETSESGGGASRCWLLTFAHGAPRLRFAATTDRSYSSSWFDENDEEVSESASWSLPVELVDADHVVTGPSELITEGDPESAPEEAQPRREAVLPDCTSAPGACPLACLGPED